MLRAIPYFICGLKKEVAVRLSTLVGSDASSSTWPAE
jgi:hypothetical protein